MSFSDRFKDQFNDCFGRMHSDQQAHIHSLLEPGERLSRGRVNNQPTTLALSWRQIDKEYREKHNIPEPVKSKAKVVKGSIMEDIYKRNHVEYEYHDESI